MRAAVVLVALAALSQPDRVARTVTLAPPAAIRVDAGAADLRVSGWAKAETSVEIERRAGSGPFQPTVEESGGGLRIITPHDTRVAITISTPVATGIDVRQREGAITLRDLRGTIAADVRRGTLVASGLSGTIRLETGVGDLRAENMTLDPHGLIRLRAFNGDVRLELARRPVDARILALSFNGRVSSEIPLQMKDKFGPRFGEATLGRGEPLISIDVINGDVAITLAGSGRAEARPLRDRGRCPYATGDIAPTRQGTLPLRDRDIVGAGL